MAEERANLKEFFEGFSGEKRDPKWDYCRPLINIYLKYGDEPVAEFNKKWVIVQYVADVKRVLGAELNPNLNMIYKVYFAPQKLCKLPTIEFDEVKLFVLPIIDRLIADGHVPHVYYNKPQPLESMTVPVPGIFWQGTYWDVDHVILSSKDRQTLQLTIDGETFDLTDEQFLHIFY